MKVFHKIERYNPAQPFKPWLSIITVCTTIDYYRKHRKRALPADDWEVVPDVSTSSDITGLMAADWSASWTLKRCKALTC